MSLLRIRRGVSVLFVFTAFCVVSVSASWGAETDAAYEQSMDFEVEGAWLTAPDLLSEFDEADLCSTGKIPFKELAGGVRLSHELRRPDLRQGRYAVHGHPQLPPRLLLPPLASPQEGRPTVGRAQAPCRAVQALLRDLVPQAHAGPCYRPAVPLLSLAEPHGLPVQGRVPGLSAHLARP